MLIIMPGHIITKLHEIVQCTDMPIAHVAVHHKCMSLQLRSICLLSSSPAANMIRITFEAIGW